VKDERAISSQACQKWLEGSETISKESTFRFYRTGNAPHPTHKF
jgi:hypothetical protein